MICRKSVQSPKYSPQIPSLIHKHDSHRVVVVVKHYTRNTEEHVFVISRNSEAND